MKQSTNPTNPTSRRRAERTTYDRALDLLEARARSIVELRRMLLRKGEAAADVDAAIERLQTAGLLDDANYALQLARSKALNAGQSRRRIGQELAKRGVARTVADVAITEVFAEEAVDESGNIERAAHKKMKTLSGLDAPTQRRRLYAFLARRGYDAEAIGRIVTRLAGDEASAH